MKTWNEFVGDSERIVSVVPHKKAFIVVTETRLYLASPPEVSGDVIFPSSLVEMKFEVKE